MPTTTDGSAFTLTISPVTVGDAAARQTAGDDPDVSTPSLARLPVILERLPEGGVRLTSPDLPGWSTTGRGPHQVARCLDEAWVELQIAAYSHGHGQSYDLEYLAVEPAAARTTQRRWPSPYPPAAWVPLPGGDWLSPSGRRYGAATNTVTKVKARRAALGLPLHATEQETAP